MVDPALNVNADIRRADFNMQALQLAHPTTYQNRNDWRRWNELRRVAEIRLRQIERMRRNGVKF